MNSYQCKVHFQSAPHAVYQALTTPEGLRGWWTVDCDVNPEVGGEHTFRFEGVVFNSMQVVELVPDQLVHWKCTVGWNEWLGTEVLFTLTATADGGTDLVFEHKGLTPSKRCYKTCSRGWDSFIQGSLRGYVETGTGKPHVPKTGLIGKVSSTAFKLVSSRY